MSEAPEQTPPPGGSIHELFAAGIRKRLEPEMEVSRMFLVVTGTREEYQAFLDETKLPERHTRFIRRRNDVFQFMPHPRFEVVYFGAYWDNPVLEDELALDWLLRLGAA